MSKWPKNRYLFVSSRPSPLLDRITHVLLAVCIFLFSLMMFIAWARWLEQFLPPE